MRALALAAAFLVFATPALAQDITGPARVIDGDTLDIAGQRIRLHGIDAPESRQTCARGEREVRCGRAATAALRRLIDNEPVSCQERDVDRYRRIVVVCFNAEGQDVGAELVREGWALAYRQFSLDYVGEELEAEAAKAGLWSMDFVEPWEWRRGKRLASEPTNDNAANQCLIKGNISSRGERIYHVPGGASVRSDPATRPARDGTRHPGE